MATLAFQVVGHPEPAGSKRAVPNSRDWRVRPGVTWKVLDDNPKSDAWKKLVAQSAKNAQLARRIGRLEGPLYVQMTFHRLRPKAHLKTDGSLNAEGGRNEYPTTKPDVLKLARAVEDAMTGIVYVDDAQIVSENLMKRYSDREGVEVTVMEVSQPDAEIAYTGGRP